MEDGLTASNYYLIYLIIGFIAFLDGCANPISNTLIPHYVKSDFLGLILGSIYCIKYSSFIEKKLGTFILIGSFAGSIISILFSLNSIPIVALLLSFGVGLFGQIKNIPQQTVIQTSVSKEQLATVYSSLGAIGTGIFGVGSLVMGLLADLLGIRIVFAISGVLLAIVSIVVYQNKHLFIRVSNAHEEDC